MAETADNSVKEIREMLTVFVGKILRKKKACIMQACNDHEHTGSELS